MTDKIIQNANIILKAVLASKTTRQKVYQELKDELLINSEITKQETFREMYRVISTLIRLYMTIVYL